MGKDGGADQTPAAVADAAVEVVLVRHSDGFSVAARQPVLELVLK